MAITAIIIDLGGVIIGIDYERTAEAFRRLGADNFDQVYSQLKQTEVFDHYETGKINCATFRGQLKKLLALEISDEEFDQAWNAMLLELPFEKLAYIKGLKQQGYQTFLFSNTNPIHLKKVFEICLQTAKVKDFSGCFVKEYYSHLFGMRKPESQAFAKILANHGLKAEETLFVDDSIQHIEGAKALGIHTFLIDKEHSIFDLQAVLS